MTDLVQRQEGLRERARPLPEPSRLLLVSGIATRAAPFHRSFVENFPEWAYADPILDEALTAIWEAGTFPAGAPRLADRLRFGSATGFGDVNPAIPLVEDGYLPLGYLAIVLAPNDEDAEFGDPVDFVIDFLADILSARWHQYAPSGTPSWNTPEAHSELDILERHITLLEREALSPALISRLRAESEAEGARLFAQVRRWDDEFGPAKRFRDPGSPLEWGAGSWAEALNDRLTGWRSGLRDRVAGLPEPQREAALRSARRRADVLGLPAPGDDAGLFDSLWERAARIVGPPRFHWDVTRTLENPAVVVEYATFDRQLGWLESEPLTSMLIDRLLADSEREAPRLAEIVAAWP
ncbi:MAG: hypothetical protein HOV79_00695 [Hamadaea sp.]|nr:hypothetical protein [Hamadaea sp.]